VDTIRSWRAPGQKRTQRLISYKKANGRRPPLSAPDYTPALKVETRQIVFTHFHTYCWDSIDKELG